MKATLKHYEDIVGPSIMNELKLIADRLKGKKIQHINSTKVGGGVAEMLHRVIPLMQELGIDASWDVIEGNAEFYNVTKKFHNALHGRTEDITDEDFNIYRKMSEHNINKMQLTGDIEFIHDPQPAALIEKKKKNDGRKWLWRCHVDVSEPNERVWAFLLNYIERYDGSVFSSPKFTRPLSIPQFLVCPAIDPLSDKNKPLNPGFINKVLDKYKIDKDKPIVSQISRYDYLKDPVGVVEAFKLVKKYVDCQLILAGNKAADDPETDKVLALVKESAKGVPDIHILLIPPENNDTDINALQRASTVVVQKSLKEGFALTVTEALWKEKPVVASAVGGIPLQIKHRYSGLLCHSIEGAAMQIRQLIHSPDYAKRLARNGKAHIKRNFLITRLLKEHLLMAAALNNEGDEIRL